MSLHLIIELHKKMRKEMKQTCMILEEEHEPITRFSEFFLLI